jgi:hypothetical protein
MRTASLRLIGLVVAAVFAAGCGENSGITSPPQAPATRSLLTILSSPETVQVITRKTPLPAPVSASAVFGAFGGTLTVPGTGLKVVVPALAVLSPTRITVTAVAGSQVAYEFEPHGIHFVTPLLVTQNLSGTSADNAGLLQPVRAGYFANLSDLDPLNGTGLVSELLGTTLSLLTKSATFPVFHFSGYLIATD